MIVAGRHTRAIASWLNTEPRGPRRKVASRTRGLIAKAVGRRRTLKIRWVATDRPATITTVSAMPSGFSSGGGFWNNSTRAGRVTAMPIRCGRKPDCQECRIDGLCTVWKKRSWISQFIVTAGSTASINSLTNPAVVRSSRRGPRAWRASSPAAMPSPKLSATRSRALGQVGAVMWKNGADVTAAAPRMIHRTGEPSSASTMAAMKALQTQKTGQWLSLRDRLATTGRTQRPGRERPPKSHAGV